MASATEQPSLGSALLTLNWERARKGALKIVCSILTCLDNRVQGVSPYCGRNNTLKFGTWNVRTLLDNTNSDRAERRTAFVAREIRRLNLDIVALSETRLSDEGQLREEGGEYTFFWKGYETGLPRQHGVGFAIRNRLLLQLTELPSGISERLMTLRIQIGENKYATIISAYAPTLQADEPSKESFYADLDAVITATPHDDKIILLGDFNARVGRDADIWRGTIGKEGVGKLNSNGTLLLSKCVEHDLVVTNTLFRQNNKYKTSWQHPRSKHWHLIDFVIVRSRDRKEVLFTRAAPASEDCWTDHRLVYSSIKMELLPKRRNQNAPSRIKFNVVSLQNPLKKFELQERLDRNLGQNFPADTKEHWETLKSSIIDSCKESIGLKRYEHQDWFDQNDPDIVKLTEKTRNALLEHLRDPNSVAKKKKHRDLKAEVQLKTREMKNDWWLGKSNEMQLLFEKNDMRGFFSATKIIYGPSFQGLAPLRSRNGARLLKSNTEILARWKEHFEELLNRDPVIDDNVLDELPRFPVDNTLSDVPTLIEVEKAVSAMKNNKAAGPDNIPAEVFKCGGTLLLSQLHQLIVKIWENEVIPDDFKDGIITTIYKKKGDRSECGNYRGITLLSIAGKILMKVLNTRIGPLAEGILPETQCGFRPSRGTTDMIFAARQLQEKCQEQRQPLYMGFIDLTKAFDSVKRDLLWDILARFGCPEKFITILRLLHDDMSVVVTANGNFTEPFKVKSGVKQGCVGAPTLFSIFISAVLYLVRNRLPAGIPAIYRTDGGIFNLARLKARTKVTTISFMEFQYADDNAVCALTENDLQAILNAFAGAYSRLGLSVNVRKTQILYQPVPNQARHAPNIQINGETLENVEHFAYLGSHLASNANIDSEIHYRLRCANSAFGKLRKRVFDDRDLRLTTKVRVYQTIVLPTLLYGSETWTTYRRHIKALEKFHQRSLRNVLKISWEDRRTNTSVLEEANITSIEALIMNHQLRWAGHVVRMNDLRLPKQIFYSELRGGTRNVGGQKRRFKDSLKANMKLCEIDYKTWETDARDRTYWRAKTKTGVERFEETRRQHLENRREARHARRDQPRPALPADNTCPECDRICGSRIGLISHLRTH